MIFANPTAAMAMPPNRYGTLIAWAAQLGRADCASVLQRTLEEEKAADKKLTSIANDAINMRATAESPRR